MVLAKCPRCGRITYMIPRYDEEGEITSYMCILCRGVYNIEQVQIINFPNEVIVFYDTFADVVARYEGIDVDKVYEKYSLEKIAEKFMKIIVEWLGGLLYKDKHGNVLWFYAPWDYRGTKDAERINDALEEEAQEIFAEAVDNGYVVVEIKEIIDEGDSIFIAIRPEGVNVLKNLLKNL